MSGRTTEDLEALAQGDPTVDELRGLTVDELNQVRVARSRTIKTRLRALYIGFGILDLVACIAAWFVIYFFAISTNNYVACTYAFKAIPGVLLPNLVSLGCFSVFLWVTILLALFALVYHLIAINILFRDYIRDMAQGRYDNRLRWVFRGATVPLFYLLALHVSGARSAPAILVLVMLAVVVELFRWAAERQTTYTVKSPQFLRRAGCSDIQYSVTTKRTGKVALAAGLFIAIFVAGAQLAYWVLFILEDFGAVPLITWLYGIGFALYYLIFAFWSYIVMNADLLTRGQRIKTEYAWIVYDALGLLVLAGLATVGTIL